MNKVLVDKARLLRRVIIISWISLALCFVIKIFGSNFFEIICENPNYKALCEYADSHFWLKYLIGVCSTMLCQTLYVLAILQEYKFKKWQLITTVLSVLVGTYIKYLSTSAGWIFDIWFFIGMPILFLGKNYKKYWQVLVALAMNFVFQLISLITKNISLLNVSETYFIGLIYMIDLYIMCILYYLYRNYQKEKKEMGMLWGLFAGKPVDKLKEMKAKREKQIAKLNEEIKAIETEIAKQNSEKK